MPGRDEEFRRKFKARKSRARQPSGPEALSRAARGELQRVARKIGPSARTPPNPQELERRREATLATASQRVRKQRRRRLLRPLGVVAAAAVGGVAVLWMGASQAPSWSLAPAADIRPIPAQRIYGLTQAARAAGCELSSYRSTVADHFHVPYGTRVPYKSNPPSFGPHYPSPESDGEYVGLKTPPAGFLVHALEHGRIEIQYKPTLSRYHVGQLEDLFNQRTGRYGPAAYLLLLANATQMPDAVAAVAWGHVLGCPDVNSHVFDAIRTFRAAFTMKATEHAIGPE